VQGCFPSMRSSAMLPVNPLFPRETTFTLMKLVRFINFVKGLVDQQGGKRVTELISRAAIGKSAGYGEILKELLFEKRFIAYDPRLNDFTEEVQNRELIALFFEKARNQLVKGYRTANVAVMDP
jgi:hypothetical protein